MKRNRGRNEKKYETKNEVATYSEHEVSCSSATLHEPIETKTKAKPSVPSAPVAPSVPKQLTARELLEASYHEIRKAKREEHIQKINSFKTKMF